MASLKQFKGGLFVALVCLVLIQSVYVSGFKQEVWMYFNKENTDGDHLYFASHQPDLGKYSQLLPLVKRACGRGIWYAYKEVNYTSLGGGNYLGSQTNGELACQDYDASLMKSLRHFAANESTVNALSLYADAYQQGEELYLDADTYRAYTGIATPINSLSASGTIDWTIFEGQNLVGKSICVTVPWTDYAFEWHNNITAELGLNTVGSVYRGCDLNELEEYRRMHNLL